LRASRIVAAVRRLEVAGAEEDPGVVDGVVDGVVAGDKVGGGDDGIVGVGVGAGGGAEGPTTVNDVVSDAVRPPVVVIAWRVTVHWPISLCSASPRVFWQTGPYIAGCSQ